MFGSYKVTVLIADRNRVGSGILAVATLRAAETSLRVADGIHLRTAGVLGTADSMGCGPQRFPAGRRWSEPSVDCKEILGTEDCQMHLRAARGILRAAGN